MRSTHFNQNLGKSGILLVCLLYPLLFWGQYAGDAQIHLVFGENASKGLFFQFNDGETSSGVTSPGFMLLIAGLFHLFSPDQVPIVVKLINLLAHLGIILLTYNIVRLVTNVPWIPEIAALTVGLIPGSVYNANIGMENGIFAFLVMMSLWLVIASRWFCGSNEERSLFAVLLGIILGISTWFRPEGLIVSGLFFSTKIFFLFGAKTNNERPFVNPFVSFFSYSLFLLLLILFHYSYTGDVLPTSGRSRMVMGMLGAYKIGPILFSGKFVQRLFYYLPITILFLIGTYALVRELPKSRLTNNVRDAILVFCISNSFIFFVLYSFVLGGAHLARYILFLLPLMVIVAAYGLDYSIGRIRRSFKLHNGPVTIGPPYIILVAILGAAWLVGVFVVESFIRYNMCSHTALRDTIEAPGNRTKATDDLISKLGGPTQFPISVALVEVQIRYWLDDRIVVRSLDGRIDEQFMAYVQPDHFDYLGYLKSRSVNYIIEFPKRNLDTHSWSPTELIGMKTGDEKQFGELTFQCVSPGMIRILR